MVDHKIQDCLLLCSCLSAPLPRL